MRNICPDKSIFFIYIILFIILPIFFLKIAIFDFSDFQINF